MLDRMVGGMLVVVADAIRELGVRPIHELVWPGADGRLAWTFTPVEWQTLLQWYGVFAVVAVAPGLVNLVVVYYGLKTAVAGSDRKFRQQLYQLLPGFVGMVLMVVAAPLLVRELLNLNTWLAELVRLRLGADVAYWSNPAGLAEDQVSSYTLYGLMQLVLVGIELTLNFLYLIRKVVIGASFVLLPLAGWVFVFRYTYTPLLLLVSEIASNAFMHASHAVTLAVLVALVLRPESQTPWWMLPFAPTLLPVVSAFLRRLLTGYLNFLGVNEEKWASLSALGVGSAVAVTKAGAGVLAAAASQPAARTVGAVLGRFTGGGSGGSAGGGWQVSRILTPGQVLGSVSAGAAPVAGGSSWPGLPVGTGTGAGVVTSRGAPVLGSGSSGGATGGGNAIQLTGSPTDTGPAVPEVPMARAGSGLWLPAGAAQPGGGAADGPGEGGAAGGTAGGTAGTEGFTRPATLGQLARDVGLGAARFGLRTGSTLAAALVGAGLAAGGGGPGMAHEMAAVGTQAADATWNLGGRTVAGGREFYRRLREYNQQLNLQYLQQRRQAAGGPVRAGALPERGA